MLFFESYQCKYTKKILIAGELLVWLAQLFPKSFVFRHIAYLLYLEYLSIPKEASRLSPLLYVHSYSP